MTLADFLVLGIIGGLTPGPITALLLTETFKGGIRQGIKVPLALFASNLVIGPASVWILFMGREIGGFLNVMQVLGALVLIRLGFQEFKSTGNLKLTSDREAMVSLAPFKKAVLLDMSNPHPYIFWLTILAPGIVAKIQQADLIQGVLAGALFIVGLIGIKGILVLISHRIRFWLTPKHLKMVTRFLAIGLMLFGVKFLINS